MISFHFLLDLPSHINTEIYRLKNQAKRVIGNYPSMNAIPHITINNYHPNPGDFHEAGFAHFKRPINHLPPVTFEIDGFDCFNDQNGHSKTIYANVQLNAESRFWLKELWKTTGKGSGKPHITVARSLTAEQFNLLWPYFQRRELKLSFTVSKFTILRVKYTKGEFLSEFYREFEFLGPPDALAESYRNHQATQLKFYSAVSQQVSLF